MKKYIHIILSVLIVAILGACEDSLGTDPDYKTTIVERDTVVRIDTLIHIDTVMSSDSAEYIFTIDSLIVVRDSLGNTIDSLTKVIRDINTRPIAPRFLMIVDSVMPFATYEGLDTIFDVNQRDFVIRASKKSDLIPWQTTYAPFIVEMDTNLNRKRAWIDFTFDGSINLIDSNIAYLQQVYMESLNITTDSIHIYNKYTLKEGQGNSSFSAAVRDYKLNDISAVTQKDVTIEFLDYRFDSESKLIGYVIIVDMKLEARGTQLSSPQSNYKFRVELRYP